MYVVCLSVYMHVCGGQGSTPGAKPQEAAMLMFLTGLLISLKLMVSSKPLPSEPWRSTMPMSPASHLN